MSQTKTIETRKVVAFADSFAPPTIAQRKIVEQLLQAGFDEVVVCPTVASRDRGEVEQAPPQHRAALASLGFRDLARVEVDYVDLSEARASREVELEQRWNTRGEVWHVVDGRKLTRHSERPATLRNDGKYIILVPADVDQATLTLPAVHRVVHVDAVPASAELRARVYAGQSIESYTLPGVYDYVRRHNLFLPYSRRHQARFTVEHPRIRLIYDNKNPRSCELAKIYEKYKSDEPNMVLVLGGDGTMLHAIRQHWRLRVPFLGLNTGHLGFLLNEKLPETLEGLPMVSYCLPLLRVDATNEDSKQLDWDLAFSDVWVERAEGQAAWLRVDVDGETRVSKVVGDGILVSTAAGSSAYARAMGAIPVPLDTPTLTLVGSNIFQPRFWKPMALADSSVITLASIDYAGKRPVRGYVDGQAMGLVRQVTIRQSLTASVELAFTTEFDPSARLLRSLFPPEEASKF